MSDSAHRERYLWSSREIEILIALWDNEDVLYNTRCVDYFKRDKRIDALERISDTLKIPVPEIRKKMTNLRTYYGKELWKEKKANAIGEETDPSKMYTSRWQFFKALDFLRNNCNSRNNSKTDLAEPCDVEYGHDDDDDDDDNNNNDLDGSWEDSNLLESFTAVNNDKEQSREEAEGNEASYDHIENDSSFQPKASSTGRKKERRKRTGQDIENIIAKLRRTSKNDPRDTSKNQFITDLKSSNPDMVFAHHVGLSLMNIKNPKTKDLVKLKIQQALYEIQYGESTTQSVQVHAFPGLPAST